jgi:hypothetical protein
MRKFLLLLLFLPFIKSSAQYFTFFTIGYNAGISGTQKAVNVFVDDYNKNNSAILSQKMNKQLMVQGITCSWGLGSDNIFFDIMYSNKYSEHSAMIANGNNLAQRDVRFTFNTTSFGLYYVNPNKKNFRGLGLSFDIGTIRQKTRYGDAGTVSTEKYKDIGVSRALGATLAYNYKIKIVRGVFLGLRPYLQYLNSGADIYVIAHNINGFYTNGTAKLDGVNAGLQINIAFGTYHYDYYY